MRKSTSITSTKTFPMFKVGDRVRFNRPYPHHVSNARRGKVIKVHQLAGKKNAYPWKNFEGDYCYRVETERRMPNSDCIFVDEHLVGEYYVLEKIG